MVLQHRTFWIITGGGVGCCYTPNSVNAVKGIEGTEFKQGRSPIGFIHQCVVDGRVFAPLCQFSCASA